MRDCPNCGNPARDTSKFCNSCGFLLAAPSSNPRAERPPTIVKPLPAAPPPPPAVEPVEPPPTSANTRSHTVFAGTGYQGNDSGLPSAVRRIVGMLVTYTWKPEGQMFALREGRNVIGREASECDIAIPQDSTLSAKNTFIVYRKNFIIADATSMSGTDVNGEPIEEQTRLSNYANIRTGSTDWIFVSVDPEIDAPDPGGAKL